jgi:uncharacterized damage-inducible protein DinB
MTERECARLVAQLRASFQGPAWHGPAVLEVLEGIDAQAAVARPIAGAHTIWELALHLTGTYGLVLRRLDGDPRNLSPEEDWPAVAAVPDEPAWRAARELVRARHAALIARIVERAAAIDLDAPLVAEPPYSAHTQFVGVTQHDLYHAGQMALLRRSVAVK